MVCVYVIYFFVLFWCVVYDGDVLGSGLEGVIWFDVVCCEFGNLCVVFDWVFLV